MRPECERGGEMWRSHSYLCERLIQLHKALMIDLIEAKILTGIKSALNASGS